MESYRAGKKVYTVCRGGSNGMGLGAVALQFTDFADLAADTNKGAHLSSIDDGTVYPPNPPEPPPGPPESPPGP